MIIAQDGDVILRDFKDSDLFKMAEYSNNEKVSINLRDAFPNPYLPEHAKAFIENVASQHPRTYFAIEYKGEYAGNISLVRCSDVYRNSAEIGYFIGEPFWNKGIMTKAVNLITDFGFNVLNIKRIFTGVFEFNIASQRVLEKCGYVKEASFMCSITRNGKFYDEIRYAKINITDLTPFY